MVAAATNHIDPDAARLARNSASAALATIIGVVGYSVIAARPARKPLSALSASDPPRDVQAAANAMPSIQAAA